METVSELEAFVVEITAANNRSNLSDRGIAWSLMRTNGVYDGDTKFSSTLATDLAEYGFSVLRAAMALKEKNGDREIANRGFEVAGRCFESLITNPSSKDIELNFLTIIAACSFHLAGYSAIAFSVLANTDSNNNNIAEIAIKHLILRDLQSLRNFVKGILTSSRVDDKNISNRIEEELLSPENAIIRIVNASVCRALAFFDFALQTGNEKSFEDAKSYLKKSISIASGGAFVTLWWVCKLCLNLIDDLWNHSLHKNLPLVGPEGGSKLYPELRKKFISGLYYRKVSEVELWPSQKEAALRSSDVTDDLVVALPTSAGKTRIAEIAALVTLSMGKRIVIVTPLRALSAQTERSFRKTFEPLGYSVSSLYGASGISAFDENALTAKSIVIATPEKLDFALRGDAAILDDVGLIILDEGHMIGPAEREVRYEILVQRLLRRADADDRRIVCLSAILPEGKNLNDFTSWLRSDQPGNPVKFPWRPTRQRFGTLVWENDCAELKFDYKNDIPFIKRFIEHVPAIKPDSSPRPQDLNQKTLFAAWKFAEQDKRVLIFITQAGWVEKYGKNAINLVKKGYLPSLLDNHASIQRAVEVGKEWLGENHPAVKALEIGVAIHHGGLPNPFLRELELLLSQGIIKVTIASPTLSQGLNINAAVLLLPYLVRSGVPIKGEEFANVAGRAGRAFVDIEGFVIHVMEDRIDSRLADWRNLINAARERSLVSGLFQIIHKICVRLSESVDLKSDDAYEYLAGNREAWFAATNADTGDVEEINSVEFLIEKLDATVLGLIEALEADVDDLAYLLEEALKGSLWSRQIERESENLQNIHKRVLLARAKLIWNNSSYEGRKGHFAMGVGLETGLAIDDMADELDCLIDQADEAAVNGDVDDLTKVLIIISEKVLTIRPFIPNNTLPDNWKAILQQWLSGMEVGDIDPVHIPLIENVFSYKMVWALEAIRMRRLAHGWQSEIQPGGSAACLENGVPQFRMAMLIRAGLPSRKAAINAVTKTFASFNDSSEMYFWLIDKSLEDFNKSTDFPTTDTNQLWMRFFKDYFVERVEPWQLSSYRLRIRSDYKPSPGLYRLELDEEGYIKICAPDFKQIFKIKKAIRNKIPGLISVYISQPGNQIIIERYGPGHIILE